jgi:hypothetical protein
VDGTHVVRAAHVSLITAVIGTRLDLVSKEFRLLPRREVTALIDLVPVDEVVEVLYGQATRRTVDLAGKDRHGHRNRDLHGVEGAVPHTSQYDREEEGVPVFVNQYSETSSSISSGVSERWSSPPLSADSPVAEFRVGATRAPRKESGQHPGSLIDRSGRW